MHHFIWYTNVYSDCVLYVIHYTFAEFSGIHYSIYYACVYVVGNLAISSATLLYPSSHSLFPAVHYLWEALCCTQAHLPSQMVSLAVLKKVMSHFIHPYVHYCTFPPRIQRLCRSKLEVLIIRPTHRISSKMYHLTQNSFLLLWNTDLPYLAAFKIGPFRRSSGMAQGISVHAFCIADLSALCMPFFINWRLLIRKRSHKAKEGKYGSD